MTCSCCGRDRPSVALARREDVRLCRECGDSLAARLGVDVTAIEDQPWGMREFVLTDPSGNRIRIGHGIGEE